MRTKEIVFVLTISALFSGSLVADDLEDALKGFDDFDNESAGIINKSPGNNLEDLDESGFDVPAVDKVDIC